MPFTAGVYVNVSGATTAVAGNIVQSAVWDNVHNDIGSALTQLMQQLISTPTNRNIAWMNGGFEVWQHGAGGAASIAVAAATTQYTVDRWYITTNANQAHHIAAVTGLNVNSSSAARVGRDAGQVGVGTLIFALPFDSDEVLKMRGKVLSLSFQVQANANWSPTNGTLSVILYTGTGASPAKRNVTPYAGEVSTLSSSINLTAGGAVTAFAANSIAIGATVTQAELSIQWTPGAGGLANDGFTIDDLQLEPNNSSQTWTPTVYDRLDFLTMLQGCKRHYQKTFAYGVAPAVNAGIQNSLSYFAVANQAASIYWQFPVELRVTASVNTFNVSTTGANWLDTVANVTVSASVVTSVMGSKGVLIAGLTATATLAYAFLYAIHAEASAGI